MNPHQNHQNPELDRPVLPTIRTNSSSSTRVPLIVTPTYGAQRKIAIAVDLSDESAYAVRWAVENYLRPGDAVVLLHVRPTSVLYGADWGFINNHNIGNDRGEKDSAETDLTASNAKNIAEPLEEARIPYKIHIVKDHDMKERLCLEVERLQLSAMIMGSRGIGIGAAKRNTVLGRLGSVSDYCVHHCVCPVVVIRYPEESQNQDVVGKEAELQPVPEEEMEYHDDVYE
ncbi:Universal stress protein [Melia azedarach]|uniref:Universal stress protein n=1 Tax=Melia azedarach TaxID=155640 RepID=A0ACC1Z2I8_MELAZ|nr:Universal stress protein [Melia azedarach]